MADAAAGIGNFLRLDAVVDYSDQHRQSAAGQHRRPHHAVDEPGRRCGHRWIRRGDVRLEPRACAVTISLSSPAISGELLANAGRLSARAPWLAWTARGRSGDRPYRGASWQSGERA